MSEERLARAEGAYLLPPPRVLPHGELPPVIEPPLHGVPAFDGPAPEHLEPFASEELEDRAPAELVERVRRTVLEHREIKEHLAGVRHEWIGVSVLDEKAREDGVDGGMVAILYSYASNRAIEVRLSGDGEEIHDVSEHMYQPPPTDQEIERAIELARSHPRLADAVSGELVGTAILVSSSGPENHRRFDIRFGCPSERLPRYMAMVDLSQESVVRVGSCSPRDLDETAQQGGAQS